MLLSIIIPTRNRSTLLTKALESIRNQSLPRSRFEVIVVDNGSQDGTSSVAAYYAGLMSNVRYVREPRPGLHRGRHAGLRSAKGEILVYADDDIYAESTWLAAIAASFEDQSIALVGGKIIPEYEVPPPTWVHQLWQTSRWGKYLPAYSLVDFGDLTREVPPWFVFGCNFSIRRNALLTTGGFHPDGMPEQMLRYRGDGETAVSRAIHTRGLRTVYNPSACIRHWVSKDRMSEGYIEHRAFLQGISDSYERSRSAGRLTADPVMSARLAYRFIKALMMGRFKSNASILYAEERGYRRGYWFHQNELRQDPQLLAWVLKSDYWDD